MDGVDAGYAIRLWARPHGRGIPCAMTLRFLLGTCSLVLAGCFAMHGAGEADVPPCAVPDHPLRGTFDGEPWEIGFAQSCPLEDTVFGSEVDEPASCWPTPPRDRVFVHHAARGGPDHPEVAFLRALGDMNLEYPADESHVELIDSDADWITIGICARTADGRFALAGRYRAPTCSP